MQHTARCRQLKPRHGETPYSLQAGEWRAFESSPGIPGSDSVFQKHRKGGSRTELEIMELLSLVTLCMA